MTGRPLVSVIVPTFNRPRSLVETVRSILNQSYGNFEIIVVNDGGVDVKRPLQSAFTSHRIKYVLHSTNLGRATARNTGIQLARGKYIAYLDDDDVFFPDHLQVLVHFLENHAHYGAAYSDAVCAYVKNVKGEYQVVARTEVDSLDFDYDRILIGNFVPMISLMHHRSCLESIGHFDQTIPGLEDWDFVIRLSRTFKIAHIKKITCEFRWKGDPSAPISSMWEEYADAIPTIYKIHRRHSGIPGLDTRWFQVSLIAKLLKAFALYRLYSRRVGHFRAMSKIVKVASQANRTR